MYQPRVVHKQLTHSLTYSRPSGVHRGGTPRIYVHLSTSLPVGGFSSSRGTTTRGFQRSLNVIDTLELPSGESYVTLILKYFTPREDGGWHRCEGEGESSVSPGKEFGSLCDSRVQRLFRTVRTEGLRLEVCMDDTLESVHGIGETRRRTLSF